ncbi:hypothetical protein ACKI2N_015650 [Cupriavidus sp. 30B13]|uniref:hypothetical protein n=1 Tax=Cupriavidus sp. 30B13 TaxID=3384241 RepID=UPI003B91CA4A
MPRKLTKKTVHGTPMQRLPATEQELAMLERLSESELIRRVKVMPRKSAGSIQSECLLALARDAQREGRRALLNQLVDTLMRRVTPRVRSLLRARGVGAEQEAAENVMGRFVDMFASDASGHGCERLDFYEVLFDNAICALVSTESKRMRIHQSRIVPMCEREDDEGNEMEGTLADGKVPQMPLGLSQPERGVFTGQVLDALAKLPADEQEVMIYTILGLKSESLDKEESTISTLCQVDSRTVRNRQKRAREKLENLRSEN